jgi:hexosaminidase
MRLLIIFIFVWQFSWIWARDRVRVIPVPASVEWGTGEFKAKIQGDPEVWLQQQVTMVVSPDRLRFPSDESYCLQVGPTGIRVEARHEKGHFYGLQTLNQLINVSKSGVMRIPSVLISDSPRFAYRGLMLDVSRHFFSKSFIMKQLDAMARYKLNTLHLHLTDAAGWRVQIDRYPLLTGVAAWRPQRDWKRWWNGDRSYVDRDTPEAYGGFYSKDDIREIVRYAAERHITVIPEIEMPGHSEEVLAVYPELSCTGKPYSHGEFCPGKDTTLVFIKHVLSEVMDLFPSNFIHIGGDEANKSSWEKCSDCRMRMQVHGLQSEKELQSWFVAEIGRFLQMNGRKLIGWDEIIEGGIPAGATVMSWRGESGGNIALLSGTHSAVMSPGEFCYFDAYQDAPHTQPEAIGGYTPLEKIYSYDPFSAVAHRVVCDSMLGVQANLWTEYVATDAHAEAMLWPRSMALAEIGWSILENKSYPLFRIAALREVNYLTTKAYSTFDLKNELGNRPEAKQRVKHKAVGKRIEYLSPFNKVYAAGGDSALVDGRRGGWTYGDGRWQGFISPRRLELVVDLDEVIRLKTIALDFIQSEGAEVYLPANVSIEISDDGESYTRLYDQKYDVVKTGKVAFRTSEWRGRAKARYVKISARSSRESGGWIFTDEVIVN